MLFAEVKICVYIIVTKKYIDREHEHNFLNIL